MAAKGTVTVQRGTPTSVPTENGKSVRCAPCAVGVVVNKQVKGMIIASMYTVRTLC